VLSFCIIYLLINVVLKKTVNVSILERAFSSLGNGNTKINSLCTAEFTSHCQRYFSIDSSTKTLLWRIYFAVMKVANIKFHG
jgi:hypothetical protein